MKRIFLLAIALTSFSHAQVVNSQDNFGSLTPKSYKPIFGTRAARKVGDVLTVVISEQNISSYQTNTTNNKKVADTSGPNKVPLVDWLRVGLLSSLAGAGSTSGTSEFQTTGATGASGKMTARMAVMVKQILPNGSLVVEGSRAVKFGRETQTLILSGICRIDDIRPDNTMLSENLANAEIKSEGIGAIYEKQRKGFVTKLLDWLF